MDREYIKDHQVVERYLQGRLTAEERVAFEELFLSSNELLDELEAAERLQQGLRDLAIIDQAGVTESQPVARRSLFHSPAYAMAASFLLVVTLGISGVLYQRLGELSVTSPVAGTIPTQIVPLIAVRSAPGGDPVNVLQLTHEAQNFVLMVDPGFTEYSHYRTTVLRMDEQGTQTRVWQLDGMRPGYEDMLAVSLPAAILIPGDYEVEVEGWQDTWSRDHEFDELDSLTFRVTPSARK